MNIIGHLFPKPYAVKVKYVLDGERVVRIYAVKAKSNRHAESIIEERCKMTEFGCEVTYVHATEVLELPIEVHSESVT